MFDLKWVIGDLNSSQVEIAFDSSQYQDLLLVMRDVVLNCQAKKKCSSSFQMFEAQIVEIPRSRS